MNSDHIVLQKKKKQENKKIELKYLRAIIIFPPTLDLTLNSRDKRKYSWYFESKKKKK